MVIQSILSLARGVIFVEGPESEERGVRNSSESEGYMVIRRVGDMVM